MPVGPPSAAVLIAVLVLLLLALALGAALGLALARRRVRGAVELSRQLGVEGEITAESCLVAAGYAIVRRQAAEAVAMVVDGDEQHALVRVDFLVSRAGKIYAAEAKGGATAADPTYAPTRRQLLEYAVTFDVDGVLLVDATRGRIHAIDFPGLRDS